MTRFALLLILSLGLYGCSGLDIQEPVADSSEDDAGSFLTGKDKAGITISDIGSPKSGGTAALPVNALLWRAALDISSFVPLADVDTFGGSILTDWYSLANRPNERLKLAIFVLDRELRSDAIRVIVYLQKYDGNNWVDAGQDAEMGTRLENLILTRAREIRGSLQVESDS